MEAILIKCFETLYQTLDIMIEEYSKMDGFDDIVYKLKRIEEKIGYINEDTVKATIQNSPIEVELLKRSNEGIDMAKDTKKYDEDYLNGLIAKAKKSWEGVDVDSFMKNLRDDSPDKEGAEELQKAVENFRKAMEEQLL